MQGKCEVRAEETDLVLRGFWDVPELVMNASEKFCSTER